MSLEERVAALCEQAVADRVFPGCVIGWIRRGETIVAPFGHLTYADGSEAVSAGTVYDVASITKSVATGAAVLKLIEDGRLALDDRVADYLPELENKYREQILVRHLLTYTVVFDLPGGLAAVAKEQPSRLLEVLFSSPLMAPPGEKYFYTNAPAILLGLVVERTCKRPLDEVVQGLFYDPLQMRHTTFYPERLEGAVVAPTAVDWRGEVRGMVHDEAAWAMRQDGRIAGNAGLFSTAGDLLRFAQMLLGRGELNERRIFDPAMVELMHTNQIAKLGESTGMGWELNQPKFMGSGDTTPIFGKTGFTGCVMLMNTVKEVALVHLSNRIYPQPAKTRGAINAFRRELADIILA